MVKIRSFEEITSWQKARELNKYLFELTSTQAFSKQFELVNQIRRASLSVMANIAEEFERQTNKEFVQFLFIAKGSISENTSFVYALLDLNLINQTQFQDLKDKTIEIANYISKFITYLKTTNKTL